MNHCFKGGYFSCCCPGNDARAVADHLIDAAVDNFGALSASFRCDCSSITRQIWQRDLAI